MAAARNSGDLDYEKWAPATKTTLIEKGLWDVVEKGVPSDPAKNPELSATIKVEEVSKWREVVVKDMKALEILQSSLPDSVFRRTLSASSSKDLWDLLKKGNEPQEILRLEKQYKDLRMKQGEKLDLYLDRVLETVQQMRRLNIAKSDSEVIKKMLTSLAEPYTMVSRILEENIDFTGMPQKDFRESLVDFFAMSGEIVEEAMLLMLMNNMGLQSKPDKWCGVCNKSNHNQEDFYYLPRPGNSSRANRGKCFQCGEQGHKARDCVRNNQQQAVTEAQEEEIEVEYLMLADKSFSNFIYDKDMWAMCRTSTNHMTPYEKYFTNLDRTHKAKVGLVDGNVLMVEGRGDVKIVMKGGKKKTISNVLFVPGLNRNVLSVDQMIARGCSCCVMLCHVVLLGEGHVLVW